jgi:integrase
MLVQVSYYFSYLRDYPRRGFKLPREENVAHPVATYDRFLKLREKLKELGATAPQERGRDRWLRIELALVLAEATGARIGAIRRLRWSDTSHEPARIRWRQEYDEKGRERLVPMPHALADEIKSFQVRLGV